MGMMEKSQAKNKAILDGILAKIIPADGKSVPCPLCRAEWNRLTPNGICVTCDDAGRKLETKN